MIKPQSCPKLIMLISRASLCRYFADLVIGYLQQVLADMLLDSTRSAAPMQRLPTPLFTGNEVQRDAVCLKGEDLKGAVVSLKVSRTAA